MINKSKFSGYISSDIKHMLRFEADTREITVSELMAKIIEENYKDYVNEESYHMEVQ